MAHKSVMVCQKVPHKSVNCFAISLFFSIFATNTELPMERFIMQDLIAWKNREDRKPLILLGARQVGKSSSVRHLGEQFDNMVEINFERKPIYLEIFRGDLDAKHIVETIKSITGAQIIPAL